MTRFNVLLLLLAIGSAMLVVRTQYQSRLLYTELDRATVEARRLELYGKLQEIVREDSPWIFMSFATSASLHHDSLLNYRPHDFPYGMEKHFRKR